MTRSTLLSLAVNLASAGLLATAAPTRAAPLACDALIEQIHAKLQQRGVTHYTLSTTGIDAPAEGTQVGQCNGGRSKVMYARVQPLPGTPPARLGVAAAAPALPAAR